MSNTKRVIVSDAEGNIVRRFASIKDAAVAYNVSTSAITYWVINDQPKNGYIFEYETNKKDDKPTKKVKKEKKIEESPKVELDRVSNNILSYETIGTRVCITPCPYRINPKPTIGSVLCQGCSRFDGMDRETHEVACRKVLYNLMK